MSLRYEIKRMDDMSVGELYGMLQLRAQVFVVEQNAAYLDLDGKKDFESSHILCFDDCRVVGTLRIIPPGVYYDEVSIGRVCNTKGYRGRGIGKQMLQLALDYISKNYPIQDIRLSGQTYLTKFYNEFGFVREGEEYLEDGLPHYQMVRVAKDFAR